VVNILSPRVLTRRRVALAFLVALAADGLQIGLGPLGWVLADQIIDAAAMIGLTLLLGFHPLFLPTFLVELIPVADMLPTWTGCVSAVVLLRRGSNPPPVPTTPPGSRAPAQSVIDV